MIRVRSKKKTSWQKWISQLLFDDGQMPQETNNREAWFIWSAEVSIHNTALAYFNNAKYLSCTYPVPI